MTDYDVRFQEPERTPGRGETKISASPNRDLVSGGEFHCAGPLTRQIGNPGVEPAIVTRNLSLLTRLDQ